MLICSLQEHLCVDNFFLNCLLINVINIFHIWYVESEHFFASKVQKNET
jgi:hypothetical protein